LLIFERIVESYIYFMPSSCQILGNSETKMRLSLVFSFVMLSGCASNDLFLHKSEAGTSAAAIVGVSGMDAKLETIDGTAFETFANKGLIHRVHLAPGTYRFGVVALTDFSLGNQSVSHRRHEAEVAAEVVAEHIYGFRSEITPEGRRFRIVDLGTEIDPSCFRPRLKGGAYVSQTCKWP
jgi:hypothetical protein